MKGAEEQGAIFPHVGFRLLGWILGYCLRDHNHAAVGPRTRPERNQLGRDFLWRQQVNLVIGKVDEADAILAHHQVGILPIDNMAERRIFGRVRWRNGFEPGGLMRLRRRW